MISLKLGVTIEPASGKYRVTFGLAWWGGGVKFGQWPIFESCASHNLETLPRLPEMTNAWPTHDPQGNVK